MHPDWIGFSFDLPDGAISGSARRMLAGMARSAVRDFAKAHEYVGRPGAHRPEAGRVRLWLSPSEGRKFDAALKAIVAPYMGRRADRARRAFLYTWFLAPAVSHPPRGRTPRGTTSIVPPQRRKRPAPAGRSPRR